MNYSQNEFNYCITKPNYIDNYIIGELISDPYGGNSDYQFKHNNEIFTINVNNMTDGTLYFDDFDKAIIICQSFNKNINKQKYKPYCVLFSSDYEYVVCTYICSTDKYPNGSYNHITKDNYTAIRTMMDLNDDVVFFDNLQDAEKYAKALNDRITFMVENNITPINKNKLINRLKASDLSGYISSVNQILSNLYNLIKERDKQGYYSLYLNYLLPEGIYNILRTDGFNVMCTKNVYDGSTTILWIN